MSEFQKFGKNPIGIYEKALPAILSWEERLAQAAAAGYDFVEMSIDVSKERLSRLEWSSSKRGMLCRAIKNAGIPILTMGVSGHRDFPLGSPSKEVRERAFEILYRSIELANDLGIKIIQVMGYDVFDEPSNTETKARFLEGLIQGAHWAGSAGVMLALENVDENWTAFCGCRVNFATASCFCFEKEWVYLWVTSTLWWPKSSFTVIRSTPLSTSLDAKVCRRS